MILLRETIRQLIKESACDQANDKIKGAIDILEREGLEVVLNNPIHWADIPQEMFQGSPLNSVYVKVNSSMPTIKCLEEKGLIRWVR